MPDNFDRKFGAMAQAHCPSHDPSVVASVAVLQLVICAVLLFVLRPPFVCDRGERKDGAEGVNLGKSLLISMIAVSASCMLHATGAEPHDTFTRSCEFLYRISTT